MTKKVSVFKPAKIKSYNHWTIEDWSEIQRLAEKMEVPTHWIILAAGKFATRDQTKLEFMNRLPVLIKEVRSDSGFPELPSVQKGTPSAILVCGKCGFKCTSESMLFTHKQKKHPLEVIAN